MKLHGVMIFFFVTGSISCLAMQDDSTTVYAQPSKHLNYPLCMGEFLQKIKKHTIECHVGCNMLLMSDPSYLEKHVNIVRGSFTAQEKLLMLENMCVQKCEACKKMIIKVAHSEL